MAFAILTTKGYLGSGPLTVAEAYTLKDKGFEQLFESEDFLSAYGRNLDRYTASQQKAFMIITDHDQILGLSDPTIIGSIPTHTVQGILDKYDEYLSATAKIA